MCVAIPGRIVEIKRGPGLDHTAVIEAAGTRRVINLAMVPEAAVGDFVISHSGFAVRIVPPDLFDFEDRAGSG